jgi:hypothetical protein
LISQFSEDPERLQIRDEKQREQEERDFEEDQNHRSYRIHQQLNEAQKGLSQAKRGEIQDYRFEVREMKDARITFWRDTFRDIAQMEDFSKQGTDLYSGFGFGLRCPLTNKFRIFSTRSTLPGRFGTGTSHGYFSRLSN